MKLIGLSVIFSALITSGTARANSGCPGESLVGVAISGGVIAWSIRINNGGSVRLDGIGGTGWAEGDATMQCFGDNVVAEFRNMSNGQDINCFGKIRGDKLASNMNCVDAGSGAPVSYIRASDARFEVKN